jgi:hypothetical protein
LRHLQGRVAARGRRGAARPRAEGRDGRQHEKDEKQRASHLKEIPRLTPRVSWELAAKITPSRRRAAKIDAGVKMRLTVSGERSILLGTFASHPKTFLQKQL